MAAESKNVRFYRERMISLATNAVELPWAYASFHEFIKNNVFGEGEEEDLRPEEVEQREFTKRFRVEVEDAKAREKGKRAGAQVDPE